MAALLEKEFDLRTELVEGDLGEFTVLVDGQPVAKKGLIFFPTDRKILTAVRKAVPAAS